MNLRGVTRYALLAFVAVSLGYWVYSAWSGGTADPKAAAGTLNVETDRTVIAYYLHGQVRCQSCLSIERFAGEAINEGFPGEVESGLLKFKSLNVQEPGNSHFLDDYQLSSWALVLVEYRNGRQTRWKNLERVWELVLGDSSGFHGYVQKEVAAFLGGKS